MTLEKMKSLKDGVDAAKFRNSQIITWSDVKFIEASFSSLSEVVGSLQQIEETFKQPGTEERSVFIENIAYLKCSTASKVEEFLEWSATYHSSKS